ncbi:glycosyltransferase [Candidatus Bathyarchaeota archaeon]|nr:glycosyltransferase [Candidatus Bathyarchaeota archaeon]
MTSLISIIIPTYCEEKNIEWCLKSIKKQKFEKGKIEIVVVDSNSPDNTRKIAKKFADKIINIKSRGVSKARNFGAHIARSEILLFLDADTILAPGFITEIYERFSESNIVCVSGTVAGLEKQGIVDDLFKFFHYNLMNKIAALSAYLGFPFFPTVCCACRKTIFHKVGGFDEGLAIAEDIVFSLKMGKIGKCLVTKGAKAYTSLRRVKKNGRINNYFIYFKNYFRVLILNKKPWINDFPHVQEI